MFVAPEWPSKPFPEWGDADLATCARWWADELGLNSWTIKTAFKPGYDIEGIGRNRFSSVFETMDMHIRAWSERNTADRDSSDLEEDVVHELVHVRLWAFGRPADGIQNDMVEQAVERIARALVRRRRGA